MEIIILGSGTTVPLADRASPSIVLFIGSVFILLDIGPGTVRQLAVAGLTHEDIDYLAISHFHPDHTSDLIHLIFATRYPPALKKRKPFTIIGPRGLSSFLEGLKGPYGTWLDLPAGLMEIQELETDEKDRKRFNGFNLISAPVRHTPQSIGYRIEDSSGNSLVYSGDTGYCSEIVDLAEDADLLILESSFPEGREAEGHLTPSQAGEIAARSGAKKLVLTHFYPECLGSDIELQCRKTYQGDLILATDLLYVGVP
ncbi:MAG: MBL fold metallo-hydrolase [Thermodesulfobacteriota bacterium]